MVLPARKKLNKKRRDNKMNLKIQKGWKELKLEIIDTDKCCLCGNCATFCDNISMTSAGPIENSDLCSEVTTCRDGYGICYNLCPMTGKEEISLELLDQWTHENSLKNLQFKFKHDVDIVAAKITDDIKIEKYRGGGAELGLLIGALREGLIDAIIFSSIKDAKQVVVKNEKEILEHSLDTYFSFAPNTLVEQAIIDGSESIALIGSGCEIQALRKMQNHQGFDFEVHDLVTLALGSFCFFKSRPDKLEKFIASKSIDLSSVEWIEFDENGFKYTFKTKNNQIIVPSNELYLETSKGSCYSCSDSSAGLADISFGQLDALPGWTILIIRTQRGRDVFNAARKHSLLELKEVNPIIKNQVLEITRNKSRFYKIEKVEVISDDLRIFKIHAPEIAGSYKPGQFVVLWLPDIDFLPMSLSAVRDGKIEITVQRIGEGTEALFNLDRGSWIGIRGPYGNGWDLSKDNYLLVGGGVGIAALTSARDILLTSGKKVTSLFGGRTKESVLCTEGKDIYVMTDDGSLGKKGFVTEAIVELIEQNNIKNIITCGPEIMMKKVLDIAQQHGIPLQASLERHMKCCVGLCGTCCVGESNEIPVCKQGPIFTQNDLIRFPEFGTYKK
ncbi:MAG: dihydroorotate dehydrogenase electron transfer subunit [Promethearchaeota archaeon]